MISCQNVNMTFHLGGEDVQVLNDINISIPRNSFTIISGPSGSGKSTLLNIITGLQPPTSGQVIAYGKDIYSMSSNMRAGFRALYSGMVYQTNYWVSSLTVVENVAMPLIINGGSPKIAMEAAMASINKVGLTDFAHYNPLVLSLGQQQRISMARATITDPLLLFADEPTGNLDTVNGKKIMDYLKEINERNKSTVILITHNPDYLTYSDCRIFIQDGHILRTEHGPYKGTKKA